MSARIPSLAARTAMRLPSLVRCAKGSSPCLRTVTPSSLLRSERLVQRRPLATAPKGQRHMQQGPVTWAGLGLAVAVGGGIVWYYNYEKERRQEQVSKKVVSYGKPLLGGRWTLVDQHGRPWTDVELKGKWTLLYFGFTHCPDICPSELVKVGKIVDKLDAKGIELLPVFISVDPSRDTVGQNRAYVQGTPDQIKEAARAYRVYFTKADVKEDVEDEYLVDHSIVLYLVDPDGTFVDFFTQSVDADTSVPKIANYVAEYRRRAQREAAGTQ